MSNLRPQSDRRTSLEAYLLIPSVVGLYIFTFEELIRLETNPREIRLYENRRDRKLVFFTRIMLRSFIGARESFCTAKEMSLHKTSKPAKHNTSARDFKLFRSQNEYLTYSVCMRDHSGIYADHVKEWIKVPRYWVPARNAMRNMLQSTVTVINDAQCEQGRWKSGSTPPANYPFLVPRSIIGREMRNTDTGCMMGQCTDFGKSYAVAVERTPRNTRRTQRCIGCQAQGHRDRWDLLRTVKNRGSCTSTIYDGDFVGFTPSYYEVVNPKAETRNSTIPLESDPFN